MALDQNNHLSEIPQAETSEVITHLAGDIAKRVSNFLTRMDRIDIKEYREMEHLTVFDLRDIEKEFQSGASKVFSGIKLITAEEFTILKGSFQKHRFAYALSLWNGSNELGIEGLKSKFALSEIQQSNATHIEITGVELICENEIEKMQSEIDY